MTHYRNHRTDHRTGHRTAQRVPTRPTAVCLVVLCLLSLSGLSQPADAQNQTYRLGQIDGMDPRNEQRVVTARLQPRTWADYHFSTPGQREIEVTTPGPQVAAALFDSNNRPRVVTAGGTGKRIMPAGNYFVRVFGNTNTVNGARIRIVARTGNTNDTAGNIMSRARFLGTPLNPPVRVNEYVGQQDFWDWFRFTVGSGRQINARVTPQRAAVDLTLYDSRGRALLTSNGGNSLSHNGVPAGTYYVKAEIRDKTYPTGPGTRYQLDVGTVPVGPVPTGSGPVSGPCTPTDSSNIRRTACPRGPNPGLDVREALGGNDPDDWFYLVASAACPARQRPNLSAQTSIPLLMELYHANSLTPLQRNFGSVAGTRLQPGRGYYLRIRPQLPGQPTLSQAVSYTADFVGNCS